MPTKKHGIDKLPTAEDGTAGLDQLVEIYGAENVLQHLQFVRNPKNTEVRDWFGVLAYRAVEQYMARNPDVSRAAATRRVGERLGYTGVNASNFNRLIARAYSTGIADTD